MKRPSKAYAYEIFHQLEKHYSKARMILEWGNNWELIVAIILSAQCTDIMVNKVTAKLFPKYRKGLLNQRNPYEWDNEIYTIDKAEFNEIVAFATLPLSELEQDIKSTGFYRNKAKNIQAAAKMMLEKYHGVFPKTIAELINIPGVGRKTANVFLGNAYKIYEGIAVDTHVMKQSQLLGLTKETKPEKIEKDLMKLFDQKDWFKLTYLLIEHGRNMRKKKSDRIVCEEKDCILCKDK
ncbi:MAG TPA: endonuclease III [Candidatus Saccharimonadales bacterium]|nr:endonuclease III [Candidatus Saccharimonadales bacterium]